MFFDIGIGIHTESQLNMFDFVDDISSKMEVFPVSEIWGAAISCKTAISCTPVGREMKPFCSLNRTGREAPKKFRFIFKHSSLQNGFQFPKEIKARKIQFR
jgi:hypothetical protein